MRKTLRILRYLLAVYLVYFLFCLPSNLFDESYSKVLLDRNGEFLEARIAQDQQWRFPPINTTPTRFEECILTYEDQYFRAHPGVNVVSLFRALYLNLKHGEVVSGGSTITMQTVRLMRKQKNRTILEKCIEITWAMRLETRFSKDEILSMYVSHAPFGGNTVGLEAATWRYFNRPPESLSWADNAMLAVLPNSPGLIHLNKNRSLLKAKRDKLLESLYENGTINVETFNLSKDEPLPEPVNALPHYAYHLVDRLSSKSSKIVSTVDIVHQKQFNKIASLYGQRLKQQNIHNLSAVLVDIETGNVLAYVGNNWRNNHKHAGKVDMLRAVRSSGSILKPFLYTAVYDQGTAPTQGIPDYPINFTGYKPVNYNPSFEGLVPAGEALYRSLNIPATWLLSKYGVAHMKNDLSKLGLSSLNRSSKDYGLSIILGGGEVNLLELTSAYSSLGAQLNNPDSFTAFKTYLLRDHSKPTIESRKTFSSGSIYSTLQSLTNTYRPETEAHWKNFSSAYPIAWKTGTSYGNRDAWAIGVTSKYAVGVWVGNSEGQGVSGLTGLNTAAPLLFQLFETLPATMWFNEPADMDMYAICSESGMKKGKTCPNEREALLPTSLETGVTCVYHKAFMIEAHSGKRAYKGCGEGFLYPDTFFNLPPIVSTYYKQRNPRYKELPEWSSNCNRGDASISVLYPVDQGRLSIPVGEEREVIAKAYYSLPQTELYWELNGSHIGITAGKHEQVIIPQKGRNLLVLSDEFGNSRRVNFEVVN